MFKIYQFVVGCCMVWSAMVCAAPQPPVEMLDTAAQKMIHVLQKHQGELAGKQQLIYRCVEQNLLPHVDVMGMSRSVLGREAWSRASAAERAAFAKAFQQLVIRTYAAPLSKYAGETVRFYPMREPADGRFARVESEIIRPSGPPIPLAYNLVLKGEQWKVYDLSVEGVSLLQSYRSQFEAALQQETLLQLIDKMNRQALDRVAS